jgi:hypothetical protein
MKAATVATGRPKIRDTLRPVTATAKTPAIMAATVIAYVVQHSLPHLLEEVAVDAVGELLAGPGGNGQHGRDQHDGQTERDPLQSDGSARRRTGRVSHR